MASILVAMTTIHDPGFLTHAELDAILSERTRQRWQARGLLPHPLWVRVDRTRVALFPNAVLLGLISNPHPAWQVENLVELTAEIEATQEFEAIAEVVREALRTASGSWNLSRILGVLSPSARAELQVLSERLSPTLEVLADRGIDIKAIGSTVVRVHPGSVAVDVSGRLQRFDAPPIFHFHAGDIVMVWHVQIEDRSRDYVLPSLATYPVPRVLPQVTGLVPVELLSATPHASALFRGHAEPRRVSLPPPKGRVPSRAEMDAWLDNRHIDLEAVIYGR